MLNDKYVLSYVGNVSAVCMDVMFLSCIHSIAKRDVINKTVQTDHEIKSWMFIFVKNMGPVKNLLMVFHFVVLAIMMVIVFLF